MVSSILVSRPTISPTFRPQPLSVFERSWSASPGELEEAFVAIHGASAVPVRVAPPPQPVADLLAPLSPSLREIPPLTIEDFLRSSTRTPTPPSFTPPLLPWEMYTPTSPTQSTPPLTDLHFETEFCFD